jgi:uncharacterized membrane protein
MNETPQTENTEAPAKEPAANETARIEAFSDGIFSIAATLLVLELKHPPQELPFWAGMAHMWPGYLSFVLSFFLIGIMWINHHRLFVHIVKSDDLLMAANLLLLLGVVFVPYPTALMAASITMLDTGYSRDVAIFYNASYLAIGILFNLLWFVARRQKLLDHYLGVTHASKATSQYAIGLVYYAACLAVTWWSVPLSLAMNAAMAVWFLIPPRHRVHTRQKQSGESA